jgi:hypothetical protein
MANLLLFDSINGEDINEGGKLSLQIHFHIYLQVWSKIISLDLWNKNFTKLLGKHINEWMNINSSTRNTNQSE